MSPAPLAVTINCWDLLYDGAASPARMQRRQAALLRLAEAVGSPLPSHEFDALAHPSLEEADRWWREVPRGRTRSERLRWFADRMGLEFPDDASPVSQALAEVDAAFVAHPPTMLPGALHALAELAARVPVAIVADARHALAEALEVVLARDGVRDRVRAVRWSLTPPYPASDADAFAELADALGVVPGELLHAGASEERDVAAALAAGARAVRVARLGGAPVATRGEAVVESLGALATWLARAWDES